MPVARAFKNACIAGRTWRKRAMGRPM